MSAYTRSDEKGASSTGITTADISSSNQADHPKEYISDEIVYSAKDPHDGETTDAAKEAKSKRFKWFGKKGSGGAAKDKKEKVPMVPFFQLFRFADTYDHILMVIGTAAACAAGTALPLMTILFGDLTGAFFNFDYGGLHNTDARHTLDHTTRKYCWYFLGLGLGMWLVASIQKLVWSIASE
ncbi:hypothetical protein GQ54DRAFT_8176, partial [Martensiomyces pterosporus]